MTRPSLYPEKERKTSAFTIVEVVIIFAIVGCLAGLLVPVMTKMRMRAEVVACGANLRNIGVCGFLYSAEHEQKLPKIEPWPSDPVYQSEAEAEPIFDVLSPYGLTKKELICTVDVRGENYFAKEGSSYQWCPMANGQSLHQVQMSWGNLGEDLKLDRLLMAFDYSNLHNGQANILFGDGHVSMATEK